MNIRKTTTVLKTVSLAATLVGSALLVSGCGGGDSSESTAPPVANIPYEVWGTDQSNSKAGATGLGTQGSAMYIWDSADVEAQVAGGADAAPLPCNEGATPGPCAMEDIFLGTFVDETGTTLASKFGAGFARMHGSLSDPRGKYMNVNMFLTGGSGGFVGIMDAEKKSAIALFQVTKTGASAGGRSVHMSFWNDTGTALFVANLHGRIVERIDISRDPDGTITKATLNRSAALSAASGGNAVILENSHAYTGVNALGDQLISEVTGSYDTSPGGAFSDLTPAGKCKENGCASGPDGANGGRPGGVIICPIVSKTGMMYITFGAGGLLVADSTTTPMKLVAEYGNEAVNGAGCGGVHAGNNIWLDGGVSAVGVGADRSTFVVYTVNDSEIAAAAKDPNTDLGENNPQIVTVFKDANNTKASGNVGGTVDSNTTGQLPGTSTRRDGHGMIATVDERYVHVVDRIQNTMDVFDSTTGTRVGGYDLTSADGQGEGVGPCAAKSVTDVSAVQTGSVDLPINDPAPDLMDITPDNKYILAALRGPNPVTVNHGGQGSCPGVGVIEMIDGGKSGKLVAVLRASNTTDDFINAGGYAGGADYIGVEHADIHGASARRK